MQKTLERIGEVTFALKGVVSVEDAKRAVDIGCTGVIVSNHGGRQLDGSCSSFDQLSKIVDVVGQNRCYLRRRNSQEVHTFKSFIIRC